MNISIQSFKWLQNEIIQIQNKNSFIIREDSFLSKGASNDEMASQDHQLHLCDTDSENTSLLINNSNISLLFPPNIYMVTFAQALAYLACSCQVAVRHDHENSSFACIFSDWNAKKKKKKKKKTLHVQAVFRVWFLQLGRIEVESYSHLKGAVCNLTKTL